MSREHIGPSLWHGREINTCTRCKYLRSVLVKSGRNPDYEYFCMHPQVMTGELKRKSYASLLEKVKAKLPDRLDYYTKQLADQVAAVGIFGEFISNDIITPETPEWCPVIAGRGN